MPQHIKTSLSPSLSCLLSTKTSHRVRTYWPKSSSVFPRLYFWLLNGKNGALLRTYAPATPTATFGWFVAGLGDLDGDGRGDLAVGAMFEADAKGAAVGGAYVHWGAAEPNGGAREDCGMMSMSGFWIDYQCDLPGAVLCERP